MAEELRGEPDRDRVARRLLRDSITSRAVRSGSPADGGVRGLDRRAKRAYPRLSRAGTAVCATSQAWTAAATRHEHRQPEVVRAEQRPAGDHRLHPPADVAAMSRSGVGAVIGSPRSRSRAAEVGECGRPVKWGRNMSG